jgi:hypothetical protein
MDIEAIPPVSNMIDILLGLQKIHIAAHGCIG